MVNLLRIGPVALVACSSEQATGITNGMTAASDFIFQNQIYR